MHVRIHVLALMPAPWMCVLMLLCDCVATGEESASNHPPRLKRSSSFFDSDLEDMDDGKGHSGEEAERGDKQATRGKGQRSGNTGRWRGGVWILTKLETTESTYDISE